MNIIGVGAILSFILVLVFSVFPLRKKSIRIYKKESIGELIKTIDVIRK